MSQIQTQHILISNIAQGNLVLSTWPRMQKGKMGEKPAINMSDYNKEEKTPELVKIKIENLQKVSSEYSNQKRQKIGGYRLTAHLTTLLISTTTTNMSKHCPTMYQCPL